MTKANEVECFMARIYNRPPLIEAVCHFRFSSSLAWDWTIPGLFYEQIRNKFPLKQQVNVVETTIDPNRAQVTQQSQPKMQFLNKDRTEVIQVAPDNLSIHQLRPYDSWDRFKVRILEYLQSYCEAAKPINLTRVELRYVNRIELSCAKLELEDYFRVLPQVPTPVPQIFPSFLLNVEIPYDSPPSGLRIIFGTVIPETPTTLAYTLDLDMSSVDNAIPSVNEVSDWLEIAHSRIEVAFDAAFTERTHREIFQEVSK